MKYPLRFSRILLSILVVVLVFGFIQCTESDPPPAGDGYQATATFTGQDFRKCACCGGLIVNFRGDTVQRMSPDSLSYLVLNQPDSIGLNNDSLRFPFHMRVDYQVDSFPCARTNRIRLSRWKRM